MLALVGSGEYLPPIEPVDRELIRRLPDPVRVACLPTAAGQEGPERIDYWSNLGVQHFNKLGVLAVALPVIDRSSANNPEFAASVSTMNFVYLSGGKPDYLYQTLAGSLVWQAIISVLAKGGLLSGCSAGAMIMGEKFFGFPGWKPGFGFFPKITILPHFDEIPAHLLKSARMITSRSMTLVGIEGNTALVEDGGHFEVMGSGGVTVWNRKHKIRYTNGVLPDGLVVIE
jgi:cyanophycinase